LQRFIAEVNGELDARSNQRELGGMPTEPVLTRIAFVVDENASPGHEIQFVATCLNSGEWMPPISCKTRKHAEYCRKAFLLVARYLERLRTHGPLEEWMTINGSPVLIHEQQTNYRYWKFLAKYWHEKKGTLKRSVEEPASRLLRAQQLAITACFRPFGTRGISPWIAIGSPLSSDAVLLYSGPIELWPSELKGTDPFPEAGLESKRIQSEEEIRSTCVRLAVKIRDFEIASKRDKELRKNPLASYRQVLQSQIPEYLLPCSVLEGIPQQQFETISRPRTLPAPLSLSDLLSHATEGNRRILITGESGSGKTTLLRLMASDFLAEEHPLSLLRHAILVNLNRFDPTQHFSLEDLLLESIKSQSLRAGVELTPGQTESIASWLRQDESKSKMALYLLDGYNEIPRDYKSGHGGFDELLGGFLASFEGTLVMTSADYTMPACFVPEEYAVLEPDDTAIREFIECQLGPTLSTRLTHQLLTDPNYRSLVKTPFFLAALLNLSQQGANSSSLPSGRAAVLRNIVQLALDRKFAMEGVRRPAPAPSYPDITLVLAWLAHEALRNPARTLQYPDSLAPLVPDVSARMALVRTAVLAGFLEPIDFDNATLSQRIRFEHDLLRDYFAACHIETLARQRALNLRTEYLEFRRWDEPLRLCSEIATDKKWLEAQTIDLAHSDIDLAAEVFLRGNCNSADVLSTLLGGYAALLAPLYHPMYFNMFVDSRCPAVTSKRVTALLSVIDLHQLLDLRAVLPRQSWLWCSVVATIGAKGPRFVEQALGETLAAARDEILLLVEGLSHLGSHDAFLCAVHLVKDTFEGRTLQNPNAFDSTNLNMAIGDVFYRWPETFSADTLLSTVVIQATQVQSILLEMFDKWSFQERHINDLVSLARHAETTDVRPLVNAVARIGGKIAVDALTHLVGHSEGSLKDGNTSGRYLSPILIALRKLPITQSALRKLRKVLNCPEFQGATRVAPDGERNSDNLGALEWNRFLLGILRQRKDVDFIDLAFHDRASDATLLQELLDVAAMSRSVQERLKVERTYARLYCMKDPAKTLKTVNDLIEQRAVEPAEYLSPTADMNDEEWLPLWGLHYFETILKWVLHNKSGICIKYVSNLMRTPNLPLFRRIQCADLLRSFGMVPPRDLVEWSLIWSVSTSARFEEYPLDPLDLISGLCAGVSDDDCIKAANQIWDFQAAHQSTRHGEFDYAFHCREAMKLLIGRERRYLTELGDWPFGLCKVSKSYKLDGIDDFVRIVELGSQLKS
jgi:hypothetical protein